MKPRIHNLTIATLAFAPAVMADVNVMTQPDGLKYAAAFVNGSSSTKYDIVFIGDGFTAAEQNDFNFRVNMAVNALWNLEPYASHMCAFNIWRVNVISQQSGVDHPGNTPAVFKNTELDCSYGDPSLGEPLRLIKSLSSWKCYEAAGHAPAADAVFVLVNDAEWGGAAGGLVFSSIHPDFHEIITHELGHKIGGLADEYPYYYSADDPPSTYTGPEPTQVNVTTKTVLAQIKWKDLILPGTPLPTTLSNSTANTLGLWQGAKYHSHGIYRPQFICQMRDSAEEFCGVCKRHMIDRLETYETEPPNLICSGILRELLAAARMPLEEEYWRFDFPICLTCPPESLGFDEVILTMNGLPQSFQMNVLDEHGQVIARGVPGDAGMVLQFDADPTGQYFVEVIGDGQAQGIADVQTDLNINGEAFALP